MAATTAKYYFRFRICWCHCLQMDKVYQETKFRGHTSIYSWHITTSVFEKQTSAILEFYFRFLSRPFRRYRRVILHPAAEFRPNRNIRRPPYWNYTYGFDIDHFVAIGVFFCTYCDNLTSYPFLKMAATTANYYFMFRICLCSGGQSLSGNQISSTYLNLRLRYDYFLFLKTNVRHIGILLRVPISTISPWSAWFSASCYQILSKSEHSLRKYDVISISPDGGHNR